MGKLFIFINFKKFYQLIGNLSQLHTAELEDTSEWSKTKTFKSVTEQNSLDEFLNTAELAGADFESGNWKIWKNFWAIFKIFN